MEAPAPLVSIVIVTYNALEYVRGCVESIRALTPTPPSELVVVDIASETPTREYLGSLPGIRLILNAENRLWCAGCNQGLKAADPRSQYLLLLNSDTEVFRDDWLASMVALMERDRRVGLVGPQRIKMPAGPLYGWLDGHCLLIRRPVLEQVGYLDEVRWPWMGAPMELAVAAFARGWIYKVQHPDDCAVRHFSKKSTTRDVREGRLESLPRPQPDYRRCLRRYGIEPRYAALDRFINHPFLGPMVERRRPYYAPPVRARLRRPATGERA